AGVNVSVPVDDTAGAVANNVGLVLPVTLKVSDCAASSAGPALMLEAQPVMVCGPWSQATVTLTPTVKLGGSLTGATSTCAVTAGVDASWPSQAASVKAFSTPFWSAGGVHTSDSPLAIVVLPGMT